MEILCALEVLDQLLNRYEEALNTEGMPIQFYEQYRGKIAAIEEAIFEIKNNSCCECHKRGKCGS